KVVEAVKEVVKEVVAAAPEVIHKAVEANEETKVFHLAEGVKEFGEKGAKLYKSTAPLKTTGEVRYYTGMKGNQYFRTTNAINKTVTKVAKRAGVVAIIVVSAVEVY